MDLDRDCDVGGLVKPVELGSDCAEDYGNGGEFDDRDSYFLNGTYHNTDHQPADLYADDRACTLRHNTVQEHKNMVTRQFQSISIVPCLVHPSKDKVIRIVA